MVRETRTYSSLLARLCEIHFRFAQPAGEQCARILRRTKTGLCVPSLVRRRLGKLRGELFENGLQLLEIDGFDQMKIKAGFFGATDVVLGAEAGERNSLNRPF